MASGKLHHLGGDLGIQPLFGECGSQCKAAEEQKQHRVGEVRQRRAHVKDPEQGGKYRDGEGRDGDVDCFSQPQDGDEDQDPQPLVDVGVKGSQASMAQSSNTSRMTIPDLMSSQRDGVVEGTADVCILFSRLIYGCCCVAEITFIPRLKQGNWSKACRDSQSQGK